jgi:hypothetical protein
MSLVVEGEKEKKCTWSLSFEGVGTFYKFW